MKQNLSQQLENIIRLIARNEVNLILMKAISISKIGWLKSEISLKLFFTLLIRNKLIACEWHFFKSHFTDNDIINGNIVWKSNLNELVILFQYLRDNNIIPTVPNHHQLLQEHFLDRYGNRLKPMSLRVLLEKGISTPEREVIIENIITELNNFNNNQYEKENY